MEIDIKPDGLAVVTTGALWWRKQATLELKYIHNQFNWYYIGTNLLASTMLSDMLYNAKRDVAQRNVDMQVEAQWVPVRPDNGLPRATAVSTKV